MKIDRERLLEEFKRYKDFAEDWYSRGETSPPPLDRFPYIGKVILGIAESYSKRKEWAIGVIDQEDLVSSICHDMVMYIKNIDPSQGASKVLGYMHRIAYTACVREYKNKRRFDDSVANAYSVEAPLNALKIAANQDIGGGHERFVGNYYSPHSPTHISEVLRYEDVDNEDE